MINQISNWVGDIVVAVIIATIIEMIVPDGHNKRYVKTIIGVFILFTIVSPIISKITNGVFVSDFVMASANVISETETNIVSVNNDETIKKVYIENLKTDLLHKLKEKGYSANNISINVEMKDKNDYGNIQNISFKIIEICDETYDSLNDIQPINDVSIQINNEEVINEKKQSNDLKELKEYLSNEYKIEKDKIYIY